MQITQVDISFLCIYSQPLYHSKPNIVFQAACLEHLQVFEHTWSSEESVPLAIIFLLTQPNPWCVLLFFQESIIVTSLLESQSTI